MFKEKSKLKNFFHLHLCVRVKGQVIHILVNIGVVSVTKLTINIFIFIHPSNHNRLRLWCQTYGHWTDSALSKGNIWPVGKI